MSKPEFLQLAHTLQLGKHNIAGWYVSTKLDGERAIWDGGISRGIPSSEVPYANSIKDWRLKNPPIATGLWSRTGKVIYAPDWFLDALPGFPLDGELYNGRGGFQELRKIVARREPSERWRLISYNIFDSPPWEVLFEPRTIKVRNEYSYNVDGLKFAANAVIATGVKASWPFELVYKYLSAKGRLPNICSVVEQRRLPMSPSSADAEADRLARAEVENNGEGIMLRNPIAKWRPCRSWDLLKHKPYKDAEGRIVGYYAGKEGKHGTLSGKIGALLVDWQGTRFKIGSGMDHDVRDFKDSYMRIWAIDNPGKKCPEEFTGKDLSLNSEITFKYRECSDDGVPKEARFWRKYNG